MVVLELLLELALELGVETGLRTPRVRIPSRRPGLAVRHGSQLPARRKPVHAPRRVAGVIFGGPWSAPAPRGTLAGVPALRLRLVARRHVDLARVASAICRPA
ncbi:putative leader peptide [Actinomycetospora flava]|uniref:putative leader peptide n=1 Tax=Actinomycetospora flava TaxID=3129232 RepID=UPI0035A1D09C